MTNEIKELLDKLKNHIKYLQFAHFTNYELRLLYDYITNLQEENEKLNIILQGLANQKYEEICKNAKIVHTDYVTKEKLQEKIDNAIEYIYSHYDLGTKDNVEFCLLRDRVLQILKGDKYSVIEILKGEE